MKGAHDTDQRNKFATSTTSLPTQANTPLQQNGASALQDATFLSATEKRRVTRETVEWLNALQPVSQGQPGAVRSVLVNWNILPLSLQRDFVILLLDRLVLRKVNLDNVRLGFDMLSMIKPAPEYEQEEYSTYFDDILSEAQSENNPQMKNELVQGLARLRPPRKNSKNRGFWDAVDRLKLQETQP